MWCYYCNEEIEDRYYQPRSAIENGQKEVVYCEHCAIDGAIEEAMCVYDINFTHEQIKELKEMYEPLNNVEFAEIIEDEARDLSEIRKAKEFLKISDKEVKEIKKLTNATTSYDLLCELEKIILDMNKEVGNE